MDGNYLGWSQHIAPVIMGVPDRPELGQELTSSFCRADPTIARHFARTTFLSDNRADLPRVRTPCLVVQPSVLRDLMDHRSMSTTLGYYRVGETRKRAAMEALARHTIDNRGVARSVDGKSSQVARLNEQLSWVAVPMGKCSEPTNVRAGG